MGKEIKKVVLAYSGGLDTSVILKWIAKTYDCEVVTLTADLGQEEDLDGVDEKALRTGATRAYVEDLREEFARDFIFPMMRACAIYEGRYLLGTSIARPLITRRLVEIAHAEGAQAVAHGATGKGNDQVRFELASAALDPSLKVIAPWREWDFRSRTDLLNFAAENDIPVISAGNRKLYSMDRNMLHCSFEGGELEDPWNEPGPGSYIMAVPVEQAPDEPEYITIDFEKGNAVAINGQAMSPAAIIKTLNTLGGKHGVGRLDMVENRFVGMKSRGVYETPGGTVLHAAHRDLEGICLDREALHLRDSLIPRYAAAVYNGFWYSPEREALQALVDKTQENVTGTVRVKLYKGNVVPVGRKSPYSLYRMDLATFEEDEVYNQADAAGFIRLNSLRIQGYGRRS
ncbi:argininosuccinate synthase [Oleidesulfovibrio alaskensis G20]|jgi:argininosuccinate synthase|uniref:Argininosuccinate synthase n=1 Tax=Oleidesulfovibrio alaskensis (strain ATCC BAA-1058 / DSM 17464 / G20) TaxID=207559 RepID=ASSY_OLEA2|nr:argininosuccinate synthase [Oleidesulfovibrio alaskensis]Q30YB8.1 RecName: Full=Argininosuccinate synthase; AltName: Full=Citrulline--aspartate ligase [Oleidesulfovibrio alaskensis G20]ABB39328.1 argininosuccinate synthase [Oleidesulfovibrio alaskensis G20]MBG0773769.1 argininosuccinate synthase [Oleidesulfovibrio alaskensis]MBL3581816.1 argininosuccinate synthase [Oleidesulfovibrio alaskensis]